MESLHKRLLTVSTILSAFALGESAQAQQIPIGEATLRFEAIGSLGYYDNPYLRDKAEQDLLPVESSFAIVIDPTAVIEMGDETSRYRLDGNAGINIRRFESISALNGEDFHFDLNAGYKTTRSYWNANLGWEEQSLPTHHTRNFSETPESERFGFNWNGSYRYSSRTRITGAFDYNKRTYDDSEIFDYSDYKGYSLPIRFLYQLTEKLELGGGLRYRERSSENRFDDNSEIAWFAALEGELSPKVDADIRLGILDVTSGPAESSDADGALFLSSSVNWQATQDAQLSLAASSDTFSTGLNDSVLRERFTLSGNWRISTKLVSSASIEHFRETYQRSEREDNVKSLSASVLYNPESQLTSSVSLSWDKNNSNIQGFDYTALTLSWTSIYRF